MLWPTVARAAGGFTPLWPTRVDALSIAPGLAYHVVVREGDVINAKGDVFGAGNHGLAFFPLAGVDDGLLWVSHERGSDVLPPGRDPKTTSADERTAVGGSIIHVTRDGERWRLVADDLYNRRITADTVIPLVSSRPIAGAMAATGTLGNRAGSVTPWQTVLSCESRCDVGEKPEHFGWVVEIDPLTAAAKKLTALGRFAHGAATVRLAGDGRCVVYGGSNELQGCLFKFIADSTKSLETGMLYVASLAARRWEPLSFADQPILQKSFHDQVDVLVRAREAATLIGGTRLDRPAGIAIEPSSGAVIVSLNGNVARRNPYGSLLRLAELDGDPLSLTFDHAIVLAGGPTNGFVCPDDLAVDPRGNLWLTTAIASSALYAAPYDAFGSNALYVLRPGTDEPPQRIIGAPTYAELGGPQFVGDTMLVAVQHPGENGIRSGVPTSHWPGGGETFPRSAVIAVRGRLLGDFSRP